MCNKLILSIISCFCLMQLQADMPVCTLNRVQETRVCKAEQEFASMRRSAAYRSWFAFSLQIAFTAAELYMIFSPARYQTGTAVAATPVKIGWGTSVKNFFSDLGVITLKSLFLAIVHQQAEPVMAKMRERVMLATDSSWFLSHYPSQAVVVSCELHAFIQLIQALDGALLTLGQIVPAGQADVQRVTTMGNYIVSLVEQMLGHVRCMAKAMEATDTVGALLAGGIITRVTQATKLFCEQIEFVCAQQAAKTNLSAVCTTFSQAYQSDVLLLSSVSTYRAE